MSRETPSKPNIFSSIRSAQTAKLEEVLRAEIQQGGAVSFARFMELALYHPELGYYQRPEKQTGRSGDFYTSVSVGSLYGELLAFEFADRLRALPGEPRLAEAGAHDGQLARDILSYLREYRGELFERLTYWIIEPSGRRRREQEAKLEPFAGKVQWHGGWSETGPFRGICFANELLDAMPVHLFRWSAAARKWREWGVGAEAGGFLWVELPVGRSSAAAVRLLPEIPPELAEVLPDGFAHEVSVEAVNWWAEAAVHLEEGWLVTADYGFEQGDFLQPERGDGTLRAFARHTASKDVLSTPGERDITAHVNFTRIREAGETHGLSTEGLARQGTFLKGVLEKVNRAPEEFPRWTPARYRQLASLIHPEHLGRAFQFLIQQRTPEQNGGAA